MRVLMTADSVGGVWSYALDLSDALAEHGVEVTLAVMGGRLRPEQRREFRASHAARCFASAYALEWMQDWRDVARAGDWLHAIGEMVRPDVVHVNGYAHAALGWDAPVVVVAHSCVPSWFEAVRRQPLPPEWLRYRREVARGLAAADLVVAPTHAMLDALRRHHRVTTETQVIPNGAAGGPPPAAKEEVVLAAGRLWDEAKNVAALARVAPRLTYPIEIAGDPPAQLPPHVRLLGRLGRAELRARMARAAVFCAPACYEPFGLAPLEAALAGCALVLGDIPSLREVWDGAALLVPPDDDDALVAALEQAMADETLRARAQRRACEYTLSRMGAAYADAYERVLTRSCDRPTAARA